MNATKQTIDSAIPLWVIAQSKQNKDRVQKQRNTITKREYFRILKEIKGLYKPLSQLAFERDYITNPSDKPTPIHCFLNNEVYWHLGCDESFNFIIFFNITDVPLRSDINCLIALMSKDVRLKSATVTDVPTMFKRCKRLQGSEFLTVLK
jgi:hypothetical protein